VKNLIAQRFWGIFVDFEFAFSAEAAGFGGAAFPF